LKNGLLVVIFIIKAEVERGQVNIMETNVSFLILMLILLAGLFAIQSLRAKKAFSQLIARFCQNNALGINNAKTVEELGLTPSGLSQSLGILRDYKSDALQMLLRTGIIHMTQDGKLYMTEEKLNENLRCSRLQFTGY
jgi:hypothetical protein